MKYLVRCHAEDGATVPFPLAQISFVLDSLHEEGPPGAPLAEDVLVALCGDAHSIFSLFGGDVLAEDVAVPMLYDQVVLLPEDVHADIVVRDGRIVLARTGEAPSGIWPI
jgi:hypothetical protein